MPPKHQEYITSYIAISVRSRLDPPTIVTFEWGRLSGELMELDAPRFSSVVLVSVAFAYACANLLRTAEVSAAPLDEEKKR